METGEREKQILRIFAPLRENSKNMKIAFTTKETSWVSANYAHGAGEMSVREAFETYKNNSLKLF